VALLKFRLALDSTKVSWTCPLIMDMFAHFSWSGGDVDFESTEVNCSIASLWVCALRCFGVKKSGEVI
jgi:hypothetical protein